MKVTIGALRAIGRRRGGQARAAIDTLADEVERLVGERDRLASALRTALDALEGVQPHFDGSGLSCEHEVNDAITVARAALETPNV